MTKKKTICKSKSRANTSAKPLYKDKKIIGGIISIILATLGGKLYFGNVTQGESVVNDTSSNKQSNYYYFFAGDKSSFFVSPAPVTSEIPSETTIIPATEQSTQINTTSSREDDNRVSIKCQQDAITFNIELHPSLKDIVSLLDKLSNSDDYSYYPDVARIGYNYIRPFFVNDSEASVSSDIASTEAISSIISAQILVDWNKGDFDTARQLSKKLLKLRNGLHSGKYTALAREVGISSAEPQPNVLFNYAEALPAQFLTEFKNIGNFALGNKQLSDFIYDYLNELSKNGYIYPFVLDTLTYETHPFNLQKYFGFSEPFEPLCNIIQKSERKSGRAIFIAETGTEKKTYDCIVTSRRVGYDRTELTFYLNPTGEEITDPDWNRYKLVSPSPFPLQCKGK